MFNAYKRDFRDFKVPNMEVACAPFEDIMKKHKNDFLYCDPPTI